MSGLSVHEVPSVACNQHNVKLSTVPWNRGQQERRNWLLAPAGPPPVLRNTSRPTEERKHPLSTKFRTWLRVHFPVDESHFLHWSQVTCRREEQEQSGTGAIHSSKPFCSQAGGAHPIPSPLQGPSWQTPWQGTQAGDVGREGRPRRQPTAKKQGAEEHVEP